MNATHETKRIVILLLLILMAMLLLQTKSKAETSEEIFEHGNTFYSKSKYAEAILEYKKIIASGKCSGELYYNLANSFYKLDSVPQSVLYYEKAKILLPNDDDLNANLKLANLKTTDRIEPIPQLFFVSWYQNFLHAITTTMWAWLSILTTFLAFIFFWMFVKSNQQLFKRLYFFSGLILFFSSIFFVFLTSASHDSNSSHRAVIFTPSVTLKSEPNETSTSLYVVHEGATCRVIENLNVWLRVRLDNGNEGWLQKSDLKEI